MLWPSVFFGAIAIGAIVLCEITFYIIAYGGISFGVIVSFLITYCVISLL